MIQLKLNGKIFSYWKSSSWKRSLNSFAGSFNFVVSGKTETGVLDIPLDSPCQVLVNNTVVITGYVDEIAPSYSKDSHEIQISGRSKTCDLVDSSAILETGQVMGSEVVTIVRKILERFKIGLIFNAQGSFSVPDFQIQQGETAAAAIDRLCAMHSLIFYDNANGDLVITQLELGQSSGQLIHKVKDGVKNNVLTASATYSSRERFSEYIIKSQSQGGDFGVMSSITGDDNAGAMITTVEGTAYDREVTRYRPLILIAENSTDNGNAGSRAEFELATRIGKSSSFDYTVNGWRNGKGELWSIGDYVSVDDDFMRVKSKLIVSDVSGSMSDGGEIMQLHLASPAAYLSGEKFKKGVGGQEWFKDGVK
jgi:prophage tail gpP-like protein